MPEDTPLFPPPPSAVCLYPGTVMHARMKPKPHRFNYRVFTLLIDLDRLEEADSQSRLFSVNRFNLVGFRESDHGEGAGGLADHVRRLAREAGVDLNGGRILLNAYPRLLGFVFNPLSVYYCHDRTGALALIVYEVRNTFGEMHSYVAPVKPGELTEAGLRQSRDKLFYVSPFIEMAQRYHFRIRPPGEDIAVRILESDADGPLLAATFAGKRLDLTDANLLKTCLKLPFMTLKVVAGIHWEALKLWLKGIRLVTRPAAPARTSLDQPGPIRAAQTKALAAPRHDESTSSALNAVVDGAPRGKAA